MIADKGMVKCIDCGKQWDVEGWDPMGGDCPIVVDEDGNIPTPDGTFITYKEYIATRAETKQ